MGIENLKRWHWAVIGILVGVALGYVWTVNQPETELYSMGTDVFLQRLYQKTDQGDPVLTNIRIGVIEKDYLGRAVQKVKLDELRENKTTKKWEKFMSYNLFAQVPFDRASANKSNTIKDFLDVRKKDNPKLDYGDKALGSPGKTCAIFGAGGLVLIGGVWPSVIGLMTGMGLAKPPTVKAKKEKKHFSSAPQPVVTTGRLEVTADDQIELAALNARLAATTAGLSITAAEKAHEDAPARPAVPAGSTTRSLGGSTDPVRPQIPAVPEKPKDFTGEFYPVAKIGSKKKE